MGLDVYTGTLTRYYSRDWETYWARVAREAGVDSVRVEVGEDGAEIVEKRDPEEVHGEVVAWRDAVKEATADAPDPVRMDWDESPERPYFTEKPDWDGYAALMLHAAYAMRTDVERPENIPEDWRNDPVYLEVMEGGLENNLCSFIMFPELWLPGDFTFLFMHEDLEGSETVIASTEALRANLHGLNDHTFRAEPETAARWLRGEVQEAENRFEANAMHGFAIFLYLAEQAVANSLPMLLDY